ncbi:MAG: type I-U CRISPR-associated protein Csx17 [Actinobacteria bacterium]|nr:type I-U CRISPR-associated protein Csx17 [Actinomycetota bacterium]
MMVESALAPIPLSSYLAAVGLLRVVAVQLDASVTGRWAGERFVLDGIDDEGLLRFLVDDFEPSPVFSPWNKEGDPTQNKTTREQLSLITTSTSSRFQKYRSTVNAWENIADSPAWAGGDKADRLRAWRAAAPDDALGWIDAAAVAGADQPSFPPLLGSGGNDGRYEFARLLHGELIRLMLDEHSTGRSEGWLRSLLFDVPGPALVDSTSGMYDGDAAGAPNSSPQGSARSASNPWAIVLAFEGLIAFGSAVASRLGTGRRLLVGAPFTIRASRLDGTSAPGEDARGEFLAPLWGRPARWSELRRVIGEGRISWQEGQATNSVDAVRAVASLGTDRGIDAFARHQIAQRNGLSYLATPAGRLVVGDVPGVAHLGSIDTWMRDARSVPASAVRSSVRRHERAQIAAVESGGRAEAYQQVLITLADLERSVGSSVSGREQCSPFPLLRRGEATLPAATWIPLVDDATPEVRLAAGIASLRSTEARSADETYGSVALALRGLAGTPRRMQWPENSEDRDPRAVDAWQAKDRALLEVLRARLQSTLETPIRVAHGEADDALWATVGYANGLWGRLDDIAGLLGGQIDIDRTLSLARGFSLLDGWSDRAVIEWARPTPPTRSPEPWFAAVRLCLDSDPLTITSEDQEAEHILVPARRRWARALTAGSLDVVGADATSVLRRCGVTHLRHLVPPEVRDRRALAVALLLRLAPSNKASLAEALGAGSSSTFDHGKDHP